MTGPGKEMSYRLHRLYQKVRDNSLILGSGGGIFAFPPFFPLNFHGVHLCAAREGAGGAQSSTFSQTHGEAWHRAPAVVFENFWRLASRFLEISPSFSV